MSGAGGKVMAVAVGLALATTGCSFLKAKSDPTQYFVLTSREPRTLDTPPKVRIGVDRVQLPEYLQRSELVTRSSSNQLTVAEYQHWGEPLKDGFSRALRRDLENELAGQVATAPFDQMNPPPLVVDIEVHRFERVAGQGAVLEASWTLRDGKSGRTLATHDARVQQPIAGDDPHATVDALSEAVAGLAGHVAGAARHLEAARSPSDRK
jgi:uncharacterized lipoprotein YmbA